MASTFPLLPEAELSKLVCREGGRTTPHKSLARYSLERVWFGAIPLLSKEGCLREAQTGWSVQSPAQPLLIDGREAHLLIGTFAFEQTAPALAARGHPRLTRGCCKTLE